MKTIAEWADLALTRIRERTKNPERDPVPHEVKREIIRVLRAAVAEEREACAKVAENWRFDKPDRLCCMGRHERIAAAIRDREGKETP